MTRLHFVVFSALLAAGILTSSWALGQQAPRESSEAARRAFAVAARFQNSKQFDLAAEDWEKFIAQYGGDPLAEKATYYAGICRMQLSQFEAGATHFRRLVDAQSTSKFAEEALLNLGWCQYSLGRPERPDSYALAAKTLRQLIDRFPSGKSIGQALFYLGEAEYAQGNREKAIVYYGRLVEGHRSSNSYRDALYALGVAHEELAQYAAAKRVYERFLKEDAGSGDLATEVRMRHAETELQTGNAAAAEQQFAVIAASRGFTAADHALWRQAFCVAQQERFVEAGRLYAKLIDRFPDSEYRADAVLAAARSFFRGKRFEEAKPWLERSIVGRGPERVEAAHWLCRIHLENGEPGAVVVLADRILDDSSAEAPYRVHLELDRADAIYAQHPAQAADAYYAVARSHPEHDLAAQALYNTAFVSLERKQYGEAERVAKIFQQYFPEDELIADVRQVAAEAAVQLKNYAGGEATYRTLITAYAEHPHQNHWQVRLALTLYLQDRPQEALTTLRGLVPRLSDPHQIAETHFIAGLSQFRLKEYQLSKVRLSAAIAAAPDWTQLDECWLYLSRCQHESGETDDAIRSVRELAKGFPKSELLDQAYYRLGEYQFSAERYGAARTAYRQVLESWPESTFVAHARYGLGWTEIKLKDYAAAIEILNRLLDSNPPGNLAADARLARGIAYRQTGRFAETRRDIEAYLSTNPKGKQRADALFERGLAEAGERNFEAARSSFERVAKEFPQYPQAAEVAYELAWAHKQLDDSARAVDAFRSIIARWPQHTLVAEAYFHVGEAEYRAEEYAAALEALRLSARLADNSELAEQAVHKMAWTHYRLDQFSSAAEFFARQLREHPQGELATEARFMQGECLYKQGDYRAALRAFENSLRQPPSSSAMRELLFLHGGQAAAQLSRWQDSIRMLDRIPKEYADSTYLAEALFERARAHQALGSAARSMADFEQAAELSDGELGARALFMIGEARFEQRNFASAINSYRRVMYGFGGEEADPKVKPWQAMSAYEAGRCAEVQIQEAKTPADRTKNRTAAVSFYRYLVESHPQHELASQAGRRIAELTKRSD